MTKCNTCNKLREIIIKSNKNDNKQVIINLYASPKSPIYGTKPSKWNENMRNHERFKFKSENIHLWAQNDSENSCRWYDTIIKWCKFISDALNISWWLEVDNPISKSANGLKILHPYFSFLFFRVLTSVCLSWNTLNVSKFTVTNAKLARLQICILMLTNWKVCVAILKFKVRQIRNLLPVSDPCISSTMKRCKITLKQYKVSKYE